MDNPNLIYNTDYLFPDLWVANRLSSTTFIRHPFCAETLAATFYERGFNYKKTFSNTND